MNLLIDSNVVLDFLLERQPFFDDAKKVMSLKENPANCMYVSASAVTDIHYIARRALKDNDMVMKLLERLLSVVNIATVTSEQIHYAVNLHWKDFEDAVQYSVAKFNGFDGIVTRNMKGFTEDGVKIFTPEEFLNFAEN